MARYEKGHKGETHKRVVKFASERFRKDGIDGVGVSTLMGDAGLTHGGFYAHFDSKEALVREAVVFAFETLPQEFLGEADAKSQLAGMIDWYLSPGHRDKTSKGCPIAALAPDLARRPRGARNVFVKEAEKTLEAVALALPAHLTDAERRQMSVAVMAQLLGSLHYARLMTDKAISDEILATGRRVARQLAGLDDTSKASTRRATRKGTPHPVQ